MFSENTAKNHNSRNVAKSLKFQLSYMKAIPLRKIGVGLVRLVIDTR